MSGVLLGPKGQPIASSDYAKQKPPKTGAAWGQWAGRDYSTLQLPGGGMVQFDLSQLRLSDYRAMTTHYQVNTSLMVLSFMLHQSNWKIEGGTAKERTFLTDTLQAIWTQLNRALSQANWSGYSPNVLEWDNVGTRTPITKVKDLLPEECVVNWKLVDGYHAPGKTSPKLKVFDGIKQAGWPDAIPTTIAFWYPLLMENGDYYGKKILKPAFTSYFFSMLLHLYANRFYERYGEPTPVGRAPVDDEVTLPDGSTMRGNEYMLHQILQLRNRSAVILPNDKMQMSDNKFEYEYALEYLESQMRGADFEKYMTRLDEEISLAIFTPILLMKTADVGSYSLGTGHMQMYLWMLNAINADRADYINRYILTPLYRVNFNTTGDVPRIKFNKLDSSNADLLKTILQALISGGKVGFDLDQLGEMAGLNLKQVKETTAPTPSNDPSADPTNDPNNPDNSVTDPKNPGNPAPSNNSVERVRNEVISRLSKNVENAFSNGTFGQTDFIPDIGYRRRMQEAFAQSGVPDAPHVVADLYQRLVDGARDLASAGPSAFARPSDFVDRFERYLDIELAAVA